MNIVLMGPSGAGKGTQADRLVNRFNMIHVSTGNLFRDNITWKTPLGLLAQEYINQGGLVPDEVTDGMLRNYLQRLGADKGVIFDGFPRNLYQVQYLNEVLADTGRKLDAVIYLDVSDEEVLINRIPGRMTCISCQYPYHQTANPPRLCHRPHCQEVLFYRREDDTLERAKARLRIFHRETPPLIEHYFQENKLLIINGEMSIEQVTDAIVFRLDALVVRGEVKTNLDDIQKIVARKPDAPILKPTPEKSLIGDVVLLGPPGSGKGTQAQKLRQQFKLNHISTGDIFRANIKNETPLGVLAKTFINRGELVSDDVTEAMLKDRLTQPNTQDGVILDGFPRTLAQAHALNEMMADLGRQLKGVLYIKVPDEDVTQRLSGRTICRRCLASFHTVFNPFQACPTQQHCEGQYLYQRDDDKLETVQTRLITYHRQTTPLINYYQDHGLLVEIDGLGEVNQVTQRIVDIAQALLGKAKDEQHA